MRRIVGIVLVAALAGGAAAPEDQIEQMRKRARELVGQMTLDEKISQLVNQAAAVPRLGIASYDWWSEALHGVARNGKATVFPEPIGMAASFDPGLVGEVAAAIADEGRVKYEAAQSVGRHGGCTGLTFWSPNINIFRDPRWGRGMETWGEDPYLTSRMGVAFVRGLQGDDPVYLKAAACAKHFAVHSGPESLRHSFDVRPSKKDLYETYLPAFRALVQEAGVESVMGAYNRVYGESASASHLLLKDILRDEFGFMGHVVSDCGAVADIHNGHALERTAEAAGARALRNGLDIECGGSFGSLRKAVEQKLIDERAIDEAVERMFVTRLRLGILEPDPKCPYRADPAKLCSGEHVALARRAARESMVLLKNDGALPIDEDKLKSFSIVGAGAVDGFALMGNYYGFSPNLVTYLEGFADSVKPSTGIHFWPGYYYGMPADKAPGVWVEDDVVIAVVGYTGIFEGEEGDAMGSSGKSGDRATIKLPEGQLQFLRNVRRACNGRSPKAKLVTVVTGGSPVAMDEVFGLSDAVVMAWYGGQEGGHALADLLLGKADFTGRLPMTFPVSDADLPPFEDYSMAGRTYRYQKDGIYLPFGYGLSYATAEYRSVSVAKDGGSAIVRLENTGDREAVETVQVYVETPNAGRIAPLRSLRGFAKAKVPAKSSVDVSVALDPESFSEIDGEGRLCPVAGKCTVIASSAAPSARSAELGVRTCRTEYAARPRLLFFMSPTCKRCIRLEKDLFSTQRWDDLCGKAVDLERIDLSGNPAEAKRYGIERKGSFVLLPAGGGRESARLVACDEPEAVVGMVQSHCVGLGSPGKERLAARKAFADLKFGIFLHWGLYAGFGKGEWYLENGDIDPAVYAKSAEKFNPQRFDAREWVKAFKAAGAKYVVITSRHHDGFSMFATKASGYNVVDATPFKRDVLRELADACCEEGLKLGFYYSLLDWVRPEYPTGRERRARSFVAKGQEDYDAYFAFMKTQLTELLTNYGDLLCIWFDGEWDHDPADAGSYGRQTPRLDWRLGELYALIHAIQPGCLVLNNHHHAMRPDEDIQGFERDEPGANKAGYSGRQSVERAYPLERCDTIANGAWGYQDGVSYKSVEEVRELLKDTNEHGANLLLNIGPKADGSLPPEVMRVLRGLSEK